MSLIEPPSWDEACGIGFGLDFGPAIAKRVVRLISARWLVQQPKVGTVLQMQLLPLEAFFDAQCHTPLAISAEKRGALKSVADACDTYTGIVMLSYPWLTRENPDPEGHHLSSVQRFLEKLLKQKAREGVQDVGLFWDFLSLPQHLSDRQRTDEESLVFKAGLGCLASLYSHQFTHVIQLKDAPGRDYDASGWCFFEQSVASVLKAESLLLDLSKVSDWTSMKSIVQGGAAFRLPPLHPDAFDEQIMLKTFTNGSDSAVVKGLYRSFYESVTPKPWTLHFIIREDQAGSGADWGAGPRASEAVRRLVKAAPDFVAVRQLNLNGHSFTREQLESELLPAFERMPCLNEITLNATELNACAHLRNRLWKVKGIKLSTGLPGDEASEVGRAGLEDGGEDAEVVPDHECVEEDDGSLRLRVKLPALEKLGDTLLSATSVSFSLHARGAYRLEYRWPRPLKAGEALPKFKRKTRILEVVVPQGAMGESSPSICSCLAR
jgi:hypothetical protein